MKASAQRRLVNVTFWTAWTLAVSVLVAQVAVVLVSADVSYPSTYHWRAA